MRLLAFLSIFAFVAMCSVEAKPFFDALYDALSGSGRRSYGYGGYDYGGYRPTYHHQRREPEPPRQSRGFKEICRTHYPDSINGLPGAAGVVCPF